ncbi:hypothetical protein ACWPM1_03765 [Tsuneonella sp. HG249]
MSQPKPPAPKRRPRTPKNAFALPARPEGAPPVPAFTPVPRATYRHDGWTPERQRAFIGALADTGCVSRAARMVNMAQANCYTLRRSPGAEEFRRAWDAALDCGLQQMKDIAFERAIEGELIPVFANGKHMGFRRKRNDALLMFCLRHYGKDAAGKRTTINYFSSRASAQAGSLAVAGSGEGGAAAGAEASHTTVTTVITGGGAGEAGGEERAARADKAAAAVEGFAGMALDDEARAEIMAALEACAAREQAVEAAYARGPGQGFELAAEDSTGEDYLALPHGALPWQGTFEPAVQYEEVEMAEGEAHWTQIGQEMPDWAVAPPAGNGEKR